MHKVIVDGGRIRELRKQARKSVELLAVEAGLSASTLRKLELHGGETRRLFAAGIADALGTSVSEITVSEQVPA